MKGLLVKEMDILILLYGAQTNGAITNRDHIHGVLRDEEIRNELKGSDMTPERAMELEEEAYREPLKMECRKARIKAIEWELSLATVSPERLFQLRELASPNEALIAWCVRVSDARIMSELEKQPRAKRAAELYRLSISEDMKDAIVLYLSTLPA